MTAKEATSGEAELRLATATLAESPGDSDQAYKFLEKAGVSQEEALAVDIQKLKRKVDWQLIPILSLCYMMQFLDKVALNYAAVMGMNQDLRLQGNDFSNVATALFVAYLVAELPTGYILNKVPVAKWLGCNCFIWGIATACTAAATDYRTLVVARVFLGLFEAAIVPCLTLIMSQWYNKSEQASRTMFWACGLGVGQIFGGVVSFAFQHIRHASLSGWRIMFIALGAATIVVGTSILLFIPDTPMTAKFLTKVEKAAILHHTSVNQTGIRNKKFKASQVREMITDFQIWVLLIMLILITSASGVITVYSTTLIRNFGFSPPYAALLNAPSGLVSIVANLVVGYGIRYFSRRWAWMIGCCSLTIIGASLMSFLPPSNRAGLLVGIYLVNVTIPVMFIITQWTAANVAGYTKRVISQALMAAGFAIANLIGPQTFRAKEAPTYRSAKITLIATQGSAAVLAIVLTLYYMWQNKRRDAKAQQDVQGATIGQWTNLTDKKNLTFRYVY